MWKAAPWRLAPDCEQSVYQHGAHLCDDAFLVIMMFPTSYACAGRIAEVLETESSIKDGDFSFEKRPLRSTVEFRHVTFAYPGADEPVLKRYKLRVPSWEVTAIVGGTGRGKSSILKLIPRLYDPMFGKCSLTA